MGADNWTKCPKCADKAAKEIDGIVAAAAACYGKVSAEEYNRRNTEALALKNSVFQDDTLREDYEIGIHQGEFYVSYGASCQVCGFTFSFKGEKKVCT